MATETKIIDGVIEISLSSWHEFHDYIRKEYLDFPYYVWRGQRDADWELRSTLDRELLKLHPISARVTAAQHLERFKLATRGRRGTNPVRDLKEDEWWALAQHNGMSTPLIDWTESPFVALYFAFAKEMAPPSGRRAVWVLWQAEDKNLELIKRDGKAAKTLIHIRPHQDENARLVSQAGLFTKAPLGKTVEEWVRENYKGNTKQIILAKIIFPDADRTECLRTLNRMNINHLSLFPDLYGAGKHCNNALLIDKY